MLYSYPTIQIQILCFLTSLFIILIVKLRSIANQEKRHLEMFNESMIMFSCYHMFCFTNFNLDGEQKYRMGYSIIIFMAITFLWNIYKMINKNVSLWRSKKRLQQRRVHFQTNIDEMNRKDHVERLFKSKIG